MNTANGVFVPGQVYHGFRLQRTEPLPGLRAAALLFEHERSGARLLHVHAPGDTENLFCVTFPTPPPDDTGLPHILEHAVLGGSRKFPVREPFLEILKMSMATFINAYTAQCHTCYPIASTVRKDFFNLAEVYVDAVFHPLLTEDIFLREGHHLTLADNEKLDSELTVSGIVYSEMKAAASSPEHLAWQLGGRGLFPDTPMGRDSGGEPEAIPALTYRQFRKFHETFYHPSNALVFIYGDIPTEEHLRFLAPTFARYGRRPATVPTPAQPRWTQPRHAEKGYPVGATEKTGTRTFLALNWLTGSATDPAHMLAWGVLDHLLIGDDAAPLKKALIDSKLGADLFFSGAWAIAYESSFHIGLKDSERNRADAFEKLVFDTLERIAAAPVATERIEAAFQQLAYEHLEVKSMFPLHLLQAVNETWPYGLDPVPFLKIEEHLTECRRRYAADPQLFNRMIRTELLENPHRIRVVLYPDREAQARLDETFRVEMAARRARLSADRVAAIAAKALALDEDQTKPNTPEALAKLPQLKVGDLPPKPRHIPTAAGRIAGIDVLHNDVFANGIDYLELSIDMAGLPPDLYHFLPSYADAFNKMGAAGQDFATIAERRSACTGGIWCGGLRAVRHAAQPDRTVRHLRIGLKTLDDHADSAFTLLEDLLFRLEPRDKARARDILEQDKAGLRSSLINDGLGTARRRAARGLSPEAAIDHALGGRVALDFVQDLIDRFDQRFNELTAGIERVQALLLNRRRWTLSFTGSERVFKRLQARLADWSSRLPEAPVVDALPPFTPYVTPPREGLAGELKIAHCAKVMPAPHLSHPDTPILSLGTTLCTFDYMIPEIRLKGNAYGAGVSYDPMTSLLALYSYADPRLVETLSVFDRVRDFIQAAPWSQTDVDRTIIYCSKEAETPIRPGEATNQALTRHTRGDTPAMREARYTARLRATPAEIKRVLLEQLATAEPKAAVCVVSSREKLEKANKALGATALAISDILP